MAENLPVATLEGAFTMRVTGLKLGDAARWKTLFQTRVGPFLQDKIANSFARERVAGSSQLKTNKPEDTAGKIRRGEDPRRGHKTNTLQSMLRPGATTLYVTTGPGPQGTLRLTFQEARLHSVVPYAVYYEAAKVRAAGILALARAWIAEAFQRIVMPVWRALQAAMNRPGARGVPFALRGRFTPSMLRRLPTRRGR